MASLRYVTEAEFRNQMPRNLQGLLTNDGDSLQVDTSVIKSALLSAEQTVESYLGTRYDLPLIADDDTVPSKIKTAVLVLAKYELYGRRDAITGEVQVQHEDIMSWLRDVAAGNANVVLLDANDEIEDSGNNVIAVNDEIKPQFNTFI